MDNNKKLNAKNINLFILQLPNFTKYANQRMNEGPYNAMADLTPK